jgi:hypothetical protein
MDSHLLKQLAVRYIWWKTPEQALEYPNRIIAQVMNLGDWDDVQNLCDRLGDEELRRVLEQAEAGQFNARSWAYWHYRLGLADQPAQVPPMPRRKVFEPA